MSFQRSIPFLKELAKNNNREWFADHKEQYKETEQELKGFANRMETLLSMHDEIDASKTKIYRVYRDIRFSNDKTPFQQHRSAGFQRLQPYNRGGYYFRVQPGETQLVGGFFGPSSQDLLHIRKQIEADPEALQKVIEAREIQKSFGHMEGEKVKTAPKGFSKDHEAIHLLKYKQFLLRFRFSDEEAMQEDFPEMVNEKYKLMRPFYDVMTMFLTTDLNGLSLL